jgi:hypothetical protein
MSATAKDFLSSALKTVYRSKQVETNNIQMARLNEIESEVRQAMVLMGMEFPVHQSELKPEPKVTLTMEPVFSHDLKVEVVPVCGKIGCKNRAIYEGWVGLSKCYSCEEHSHEMAERETIKYITSPEENSGLYSNTCNGDVERPRQDTVVTPSFVVRESVPPTWGKRQQYTVTTAHKSQGGTWEDLFKAYDGTKWQEGTAGNCNIVCFDGDDIRGIGRINDDVLRKWVIDTFNARPKQESKQPWEIERDAQQASQKAKP